MIVCTFPPSSILFCLFRLKGLHCSIFALQICKGPSPSLPSGIPSQHLQASSYNFTLKKCKSALFDDTGGFAVGGIGPGGVFPVCYVGC